MAEMNLEKIIVKFQKSLSESFGFSFAQLFPYALS